MNAFKTLGQVLALSALALGTATGCVWEKGLKTFTGQISLKGQPVSGSSITLWQTQAGQSPKQLSTQRSNTSGAFSIKVQATQGVVHYLVAEGGDIGGSSADHLTMLTVLGENDHQQVAINELTTVGSVWPNAQLLEGTALEGSQSALAIGSSQVENLVDQSTGGFGAALLKSTNLLNSETAARMNVLSDLIALCGQQQQSQACNQLLALTNSDNTLSAMTSIARLPWKNAGELYQLFQSSYPINKATELRTTATAPYLLFQPKSFSLSLVFDGGGALALGKLMFDGKGSMWSGTNWMPGSQSGVVNNIGGGVTHFGPGSTPL